MSTVPNTSPLSQPKPETGWDEATFRCGLCGAVRTATTEDAYLRTVVAHQEAHEVAERLNAIERDGLASILRVVLAAPELGAEFLLLLDQQARATPAEPTPQQAAPAVDRVDTPRADLSSVNGAPRS
ncbi:hypothetical protein [Streptomyces capitiformicae]|uniref:Uncharacterized protein n=1 Tax=Streptomyces capitiformicae TaxID=2014920 RepID=A0A919DCB6_9ACTN|nr:hypothetical protein [Streptomyces capitiformicae]GHE34168.1 hypothetical protein GCM10017771_51590 [Streptomyces capitiformicae]